MKKLRIFGIILATVVSTLSLKAQEATGITITVTIENVLSSEGQIIAGLHTEDTFMKGEGIASQLKNASKGEMTLMFNDVTPGTYAIMLLHDTNGNNRMDFEANGMPKESYTNSGNIEMYGPPTFAGAKFEVSDENQEISLRF